MSIPYYLQNVLGRLNGAKQVGEHQWEACCPAHDDHHPSLRISLAEDGNILLHCHAGCTPEQVVAAIGLQMSDLFPPKERSVPTVNLRELAVYPYRDSGGTLRYEVVRYEPKDFRQRRPGGHGGHIWNMDGVERILYCLPELLAADLSEFVFVVEGEEDVNRLRSLGLVATCNVGGAGKWRDEYNQPLRGRKVILLGDNDEPGRKHVQQVARSLHGIAAEVRVLELPGLPPKGDVSDWLDAGHTIDELRQLAAQAPVWTPVADSTGTSHPAADNADEDRGRQSQADRLVEVAEGLELFHTPGQDGSGYAVVPVGDHFETWRIGSRTFRNYLGQAHYKRYRKVANSQAVQDALNAINGKAIFDGPEQPVHLRVAEADGAYWLDLGNGSWQAIKITPDGWSVCDRPPVKFIRSRSMLALPSPVPGGSLAELRELLNLPDDKAWTLLLSWYVQALRARGPYPLLNVTGEQGCGKTDLSRMSRGLIDPNEAPLRAEPKNAHDLMIAANNGWILAFDNLSRVPPWLSDALCRLSTGGGFSTRELYSDSDEKIFQAMRPVILNGIEELATRPDLLDRSIVLTLPRIPEAKRRTEADLMRHYEEARPRILGALLSAVSAAMKNLPHVELPGLPRMADFACWATAAEPALGLKPGQFLAAFTENRDGADSAAIEASLIGPAILRLMAERNGWRGTVGDLLDELERLYVNNNTLRNRDWPNGPARFAGQLRRIAPNLRRMGVEVTLGERGNRGKSVYLERVCEQSSPPTQPALILPDSPFDDAGQVVPESAKPGIEPPGDVTSDDREGGDGLALASSGHGREEVDL